MAKRPVYIVSDIKPYCRCKMTDFEYHSGFSLKQKQRNIESLHKSFLAENPARKVLEISTKSENLLGISLSAFNLMIRNKQGEPMFSVETAFQASKVFEKGGPYMRRISRNGKVLPKGKDSHDR